MTTAREREKLEAIGYVVRETTVMTSIDRIFVAMRNGIAFHSGAEWDCLNACKSDAQSPDGMKATMADKVRWLTDLPHHPDIRVGRGFAKGRFIALDTANGKHGEGDSPETAVDALFWSMP